MGILYRSSSGVETPVAGLAPAGQLVPSVSLYQTGSFEVEALPAGGYIDSGIISLQTPFPDTDYVITFDFEHSSLIAGAIQKSASNFSVVIGNVDPNGSTNASTCYWKAFKLMTDESRALDEARIEQNTTNFALAFSTTTSYAVGDYVTYNNILYRCTTAHTAGVWVAGHFTQVTVGGEITYRKGTLSINPSESSNFDEGYCRYEETNTHILISGRFHCNSDASGAHMVFINLPAISFGDIAPVVVTNSTNDIGTSITTYARYEGTSIHFNDVKAGFNRFSAVYVKP